MLKSCCPVPLAGEPDPPTPPQLSPGWASSPVLGSPSRLQPHQYSLLSSNTRQGRCCLGRGAAAPSAESCPPRHSRGSLTSFQPELDVSCPVRHPPCSAPPPGLRSRPCSVLPPALRSPPGAPEPPGPPVFTFPHDAITFSWTGSLAYPPLCHRPLPPLPRPPRQEQDRFLCPEGSWHMAGTQ